MQYEKKESKEDEDSDVGFEENDYQYKSFAQRNENSKDFDYAKLKKVYENQLRNDQLLKTRQSETNISRNENVSENYYSVVGSNMSQVSFIIV